MNTESNFRVFLSQSREMWNGLREPIAARDLVFLLVDDWHRRHGADFKRGDTSLCGTLPVGATSKPETIWLILQGREDWQSTSAAVGPRLEIPFGPLSKSMGVGEQERIDRPKRLLGQVSPKWQASIQTLIKPQFPLDDVHGDREIGLVLDTVQALVPNG
jgi:hypothetical protein